MASKVFAGNVSIIMNTKNEISLKRDDAGRFTAADAAEIYNKMMELSKRHKVGINKYALFVADKTGIPVLLVNRYGNPYLALLPPPQGGGTRPPRKGVVKLA